LVDRKEGKDVGKKKVCRKEKRKEGRMDGRN